MRGEPYTRAVLTAHFWDGDPPDECLGAFLQTARGTTYRLESARELPSGSWRLEVTRWPAEDVPEDAMVVGWAWTRRRRSAGRNGR
ncbi:MAG TPA: hypothetical protein VF192_01065 [Longimicrobiales bacterium]